MNIEHKLPHELIDEHWEREATFARLALEKAQRQLTASKRSARNPNQLRLNVTPNDADVIEMRIAL